MKEEFLAVWSIGTFVEVCISEKVCLADQILEIITFLTKICILTGGHVSLSIKIFYIAAHVLM